ncbi:acylphosphatase [Liberiplasma polymorphum]|uniref:acylphosphatase n=1 Tax=Liberiplasma polymorphum TaxID=3374570 RepID=UPI003770C149
MINLYLKLTGRVQGVGMRYFISHLAHKYELKGYVKNLSDGSVECVVEGKEELIKEFFDKLKSSSPGVIENITKHESPYTKSFTNFEVRYF